LPQGYLAKQGYQRNRKTFEEEQEEQEKEKELLEEQT
jgi:hypothetical protein